ncbi:Cell division protein FtsA [Porphyromonas macacae]|uniref:Cell division protein FtsA n=2 Tax=Porphyromonas macacae TaxID=28115 RepID=A0A379E5M1_9PORP|nr:cell division protein FtsA [Porphyromonas macacae]SUB87985.1 Cell division protein FtsA [Porphyromonas macacae]
MKEELYVVIDLGSTYTVGLVGSKLPDGHVIPVAVHTERSMGCIRHGYIYNIDATATMLRRIIESLNSRLDEQTTIKSVYVGLGCQSMISRSFTTEMDLGEEGEIITQDHLEQLREKANNVNFEGASVVMVTDPLYYVDGRPETNPQGIRCSRIEVCFQVITVRKNIITNIHTVIENHLKLELAGILISPIAEARAVLNNEERTLGCAFVNMGGGCTTVSIYNNRLLAALYVLPFGGQNVTRDLTSLRLVEPDAEALKISNSSMMLEGIRDRIVTISSADQMTERKIRQQDINQLVAARMNEITYNYINLIKESGYEEKLGAGLIMTGGAIKIDGYIQQLREYFDPFRYASIRRDLVDETSDILRKNESDRYLTAIALLAMAEKNCVNYKEKSLSELYNEADYDEKDAKATMEEETDSLDLNNTDKVITVTVENETGHPQKPQQPKQTERQRYEETDEEDKEEARPRHRSALTFAKGLRNFGNKLSDLFNADEDEEDNR